MQSTTFAWRFDGLIASRGWPTGTNAATFNYDRSKRPTTLTEKLSGADQAVFTQTYDRSGTVTAEGRTLSGISGIAGTGSQSFTYDPLHRVTGSTLSGGPSQIYTYDANSNRLSWNDGTATTTYDYNEADELTAQHRSGIDRTYTYDSYGNMTSSAVASAGATSYTYDTQDRVKSITPPSSGALTFTLDALGRHWTKSVGGGLADTYGYIGASEAVVRIDQTSGSVSAAIDAGGNRVATSTSAGVFGWLLPSLHGDVAGALSSSGAAISDAFRYSAYGVTLAKTTSTLPSPWRFQGRLALNSDDGTGVNTDLYDFVARAYDPNLAAFTSLDSVAGGAQNPLTLNRFVYALARPTTLIDPTGHYATVGDDASPAYYQPQQSRPAYSQATQQEQFGEQHAMRQQAQSRLATTPRRSTDQPDSLADVPRIAAAERYESYATVIDAPANEVIGRAEQIRLNAAAGSSYEKEVGRWLQQTYGNDYEIIHNRGIVGKDGRVLRDADGRLVRPDYQLIARKSGRLAAVLDAKAGTITYLRGRAGQAILRIYETLSRGGYREVPVIPSYRLQRPRAQLMGRLGTIANVLMLVDLFAVTMAEAQFDRELEWYRENDPLWYQEIDREMNPWKYEFV